jgi:MOSC domain-containing protein YiiM
VETENQLTNGSSFLSGELEGELISINVAMPRHIAFRGQPVMTGIFKKPVSGPVMVGSLNLEGDAQADLRVHGGLDKAVYVYQAENYVLWQRELGRALTYGTFGENLTVTMLGENSVCVGDVLAVGEVLLQVTQPRFPCFKLGIVMRDQRFLKRFLDSGRTGYYCRVLQEGTIKAGEKLKVVSRDDDAPTIVQTIARLGSEP